MKSLAVTMLTAKRCMTVAACKLRYCSISSLCHRPTSNIRLQLIPAHRISIEFVTYSICAETSAGMKLIVPQKTPKVPSRVLVTSAGCIWCHPPLWWYITSGVVGGALRVRRCIIYINMLYTG